MKSQFTHPKSSTLCNITRKVLLRDHKRRTAHEVVPIPSTRCHSSWRAPYQVSCWWGLPPVQSHVRWGGGSYPLSGPMSGGGLLPVQSHVLWGATPWPSPCLVGGYPCTHLWTDKLRILSSLILPCVGGNKTESVSWKKPRTLVMDTGVVI